MRAIRIHQPGGPEALTLDDLPAPQPAPGEALVRVKYAGLNFIDVYQRSGQYRLNLPAILGSEGMGTVEAVGEGVTDLQPGARVAWAMHPGSYAEQVSVPAWKLVPVPDRLDDQTAAASLLQGLTAHYLARSTFELRKGHTCLVHAAAGGAGQLLVQIAHLSGARVIGTAGSDEKVRIALEAGADHAINYTTRDFEAEVRELTDGRGVDVVYDSVGRSTFQGSLNSLRPRGMMVLYGAASGPVEPLDLQVLNQKGSLFVTRPSLAHHTATREELLQRAEELFGWIQDGKVQVHVDQVFPLDRAADAHRYIEGRQTKGKVLLQVG